MLNNSLTPLLISGQPIDDDLELRFPVTCAATGEVVHYAQGASLSSVQVAVGSAADAFAGWAAVGYLEKRRLFNFAAQVSFIKGSDSSSLIGKRCLGLGGSTLLMRRLLKSVVPSSTLISWSTSAHSFSRRWQLS
jgi:hypothetical protein